MGVKISELTSLATLADADELPCVDTDVLTTKKISFTGLKNSFITNGTWTPSIGGTAAYTTRVGLYTKIGRVVHISCWLVINTIGTGSPYEITGLPFALKADAALTAAVLYSALATNATTLIAYGVGGTTLELRGSTAAAAGLTTNTWLGNGATVLFSATYITD